MNTNSKHYELLAIEPWNIMEANFPPEQFVAYLKGNIIKYTLRDKRQALTDAQKIKHYAEKLIEVLESKWEPEFKVGDRVRVKGYEYYFNARDTKEATVIKVGVPYQEKSYLLKLDDVYKGWRATLVEDGVECSNAWCVTEDEIELIKEESPLEVPICEPPKAKPQVVHKFKVGDRVKVIKHNETGTIIRLPKKDLRDVDRDNYIVELDEEYTGWTANIKDQAVESDNAWYAADSELEFLKEEPKTTLEPYKWYDAEDFTVEELEELLPVGTTVTVTREHDNDRKVNLVNERLLSTTVTNIGKRCFSDDVRVGITGDCYWRRYFKIVEE